LRFVNPGRVVCTLGGEPDASAAWGWLLPLDSGIAASAVIDAIRTAASWARGGLRAVKKSASA
jgi:hypothetical protein